MKKILLVVTIIFSIICLTACDPASYHFNYDELLGDTERIELIQYENQNPSIIKVDNNATLIFELERMQVKKVLSSVENSKFLEDLSTITFHLVNSSADSPTGKCVRIVLKNGNFIIISCSLVNETSYSFVAEFSEQGKFVRHIAHFADRPKYEKLLNNYF